MTVNIAVIGSHMGPYHWARARATAALTPHCTFVEVCSSEQKYPWTGAKQASIVNHVCLFEKPIEMLPQRQLIAAVEGALDRIQPEVVFVPGYSAAYLRRAAAWAKEHGGAAVLFTDSWEADRRRIWLKEWVKHLIVARLYDAAFAAGERAARYIQKLGIRPDRIWRGVDVVDNDHFTRGAERSRAQSGLRERLALPADYFICVARFSSEKNLPMLLEAFAQYRRAGGPWQLVMVGDGPMKAELQERVQADDLAGSVQLRPWASYDELPALYAFARCLVLPSASEPWGLVVNEAMSCNLPVLVSNPCGCVPELCRMGVNGYVFDHRNPAELAAVMTRVSDGSTDLEAMGQASREIVTTWTVDAWARSLVDCANVLARETS